MQTYYMKNLEYYLRVESGSDYAKKVRQHFQETFQAIRAVHQIRKPSDETVYRSQYRCLAKDSQKEVLTRSFLLIHS